MRSRSRLLVPIAIIITTIFIGFFGHRATWASELEGGSISGRISLFNNDEIDWMTITLYRVEESTNGRQNLAPIPEDEFRLAVDRQSGSYGLSNIPPGIYKLRVSISYDPLPHTDFDEWYDNATSYSATEFHIEHGSVYENIDFVMGEGSTSIRGRVTDEAGEPLGNIRVVAYFESGQQIAATATDKLGLYHIRRGHNYPQAQAAYIVFSSYDEEYVSEFFDDGVISIYPFNWPDPNGFPVGTVVLTGTAGVVGNGIDAVLQRPTQITGTVTSVSGQPLAEIEVRLQLRQNYRHVETTYTDEQGNYEFTTLPGLYRVEFARGSLAHAGEWYDNAEFVEAADVVTHTASQNTSHINAVLEEPGFVSGMVQDSDGQPVKGRTVLMQSLRTGHNISTVTDAAGNFRTPVPTSSYIVQFYGDSPDGNPHPYLGQFWKNASSFSSATEIFVSGQRSAENIGATMIRAGSIAGTAELATPLLEFGTPSIRIFRADNTLMQSVPINPDGTFFAYALRPGAYEVTLLFTWGGRTTEVPYENPDNPGVPQLVLVESNLTTENVDFHVGMESGFAWVQVFDSYGYPMNRASVSLLDSSSQRLVQRKNYGGNGIYTFAVPTGEYFLHIRDVDEYLQEEYFNNAFAIDDATPILLGANELVSIPNIHLSSVPTAISMSENRPQAPQWLPVAMTGLMIAISLGVYGFTKPYSVQDD